MYVSKINDALLTIMCSKPIHFVFIGQLLERRQIDDLIGHSLVPLLATHLNHFVIQLNLLGKYLNQSVVRSSPELGICIRDRTNITSAVIPIPKKKKL